MTPSKGIILLEKITSNQVGIKTQTRSSKKVSFCSVVDVNLVPSVSDYRNALLFDALWWNTNDFNSFQLSYLASHASVVSNNERKRTSDQIVDRSELD